MLPRASTNALMNACGLGKAARAAWNAADSAVAPLRSASITAWKAVLPAAIPAWIVWAN